MRRCQPLLDAVESIAGSTTDDVFDDDRRGPHEAVESTLLRHRCVEPFKRQRIAHRVRIDADLVGRLDQRAWRHAARISRRLGRIGKVVFDLVGSTQHTSRCVWVQPFGHAHIVRAGLWALPAPAPAKATTSVRYRVEMSDQPPLSQATLAISAGRANSGNSLAPALWASSTWESAGLDDAHHRATSVRHGDFYSRYANPTVQQFEHAIAELEGAEAALAFGSGMGAIAATVLALCSTGSHIVAQRQLYAGTLAFLQGPCQRFGIDVTFVDVATPGAFSDAVIPGKTMLVIAESPSNPRLELADLDELGAIRGPFTLVDATFSTPLGQQPLAYGVDLSLHSATKGIAGHNDATLGVISGEQELLDEIWAYAVLHGSTPSPFDALNALRGVRTLAVRTRQQNDSARSLAVMLADHPACVGVHYPGLSEHPQHALASRQLLQYGTVLSFEVPDRAAAAKFMDTVAVARCATSLGGPETLVCHPATSTHASLTPDEQAAAGISDGLIRVSVGLEETTDLLDDFEQALG
jgi:cystathionine beta-lyase/cystathionine gamma-synthase